MARVICHGKQVAGWLPVLLAFMLVSCGPKAADIGAGGTDAPVADATAADEPGVTVAPPADGSPVDPAAQTEAPVTPDATVQALAASFEIPVRGDRNAPLVIYDFSDYL